jgi:hypothetical protein
MYRMASPGGRNDNVIGFPILLHRDLHIIEVEAAFDQRPLYVLSQTAGILVD